MVVLKKKNLLLDRRSFPWTQQQRSKPSFSLEVWQHSVYRPCWHFIASNKLKQSISWNGQSWMCSSSVLGHFGHRTSKVLIPVHPCHTWIYQIMLTQFLCHVELWLELPESFSSILFQFHIQEQKLSTVSGHFSRWILISTQALIHGNQMLGSSQHRVFQRFVVVQSALSKLQKLWHQGSHFSSTSPELWGSVLALGILFPDHQGSQTGELVGPAWVVPVPRLQMPMQNLALLLDVSARKTRQHMKQQVASKVCSHTQIHAMQPVNHKCFQCDTRNGEQGWHKFAFLQVLPQSLSLRSPSCC